MNDDTTVLEQMARLLAQPGGRPTSPIEETPADEAEAFGAWRCSTRRVLPNAADLSYVWGDVPGVGTNVSIDRIGTLGLTEAGQASWTVTRDDAPAVSFYAPETATREQLLVWARLTVSALVPAQGSR